MHHIITEGFLRRNQTNEEAARTREKIRNVYQDRVLIGGGLAGSLEYQRNYWRKA